MWLLGSGNLCCNDNIYEYGYYRKIPGVRPKVPYASRHRIRIDAESDCFFGKEHYTPPLDQASLIEGGLLVDAESVIPQVSSRLRSVVPEHSCLRCAPHTAP